MTATRFASRRGLEDVDMTATRLVSLRGLQDVGRRYLRRRITSGARRRRETELKVDFIEVDVDACDLGTTKWDAVTMIYAGHDAKLVERVKQSLEKDAWSSASISRPTATPRRVAPVPGSRASLRRCSRANGYTIIKDEVVDRLGTA